MIRRRRKYNAQACRCSHDHRHDSRLESARCETLHLLMRAKEELYGGRIVAIENQPTLELRVNGVLVCKYRPDFGLTVENSLDPVYEDAKGFETDVFRIKRKLYDALHPGNPLRVVKQTKPWP